MSQTQPKQRIENEDTQPKVAPWLKKLPNQLTYLRMAIIPLVVTLLILSDSVVPGVQYVPTWYDIAAGWLFGLAAATDFFDGWLARKYQVESIIGKLLDPLADKLLVVSTLIVLVEKHKFAAWIAVALIVRDLGINAVRVSAIEDNISIPSGSLGKIKTILLDLGIVGLIVYGHGPLLDMFNWNIPGQVLIYLALTASLVSAFQYLKHYAKELKRLGKN